jgi:predicted ATPase
MTQFGRYDLLVTLGRGGMGEVHLARAPGLRQPVVIKRLLSTFMADSEMLTGFLDETRIAARLRHPNIIRIDELGEVDGEWFIRMEYVEGASLAQLVKAAVQRSEGLPIETVLTVGACVGSALDYAHHARDAAGRALNIVHRDVTPQNILLGRKGPVKLIDFGVALAEQRFAHTSPGLVKGKLAYMSPEQVSGGAIDFRTDLFALGVCLWEGLTGVRLFQAQTQVEAMARIMACEVPPPSLHRPRIPPEVDALVLKALSREPSERFARGLHLAEAIATVADQFHLELGARAVSNSVRRLMPDAGHLEGLGPEEEPTGLMGSAPSKRATVELRVAQPPTPDERAAHLPLDDTPLVGRAAELAELHQLQGAETRLVTLHGPSGVGKSRLGRELARQRVAAHEGRVWVADLGRAADLDAACACIADALGVALPGGNVVDGVEALLAGRRRGLLVLDGVEALLKPLAGALGGWLQSTRTHFVVCSRVELGVATEKSYEVGPLPLGGTDEAPSEAEQLFLARATAANPEFPTGPWVRQTVRELVTRLEGLPLAIELAAAQASATPIGALHEVMEAARLAPALAGLDSAFATTWESTSRGDQSCVAQCCVFTSGFTAEAAARVLTPPGASSDEDDRRRAVLQVLHRLRARSLLRVTYSSSGQLRYDMYDSLRERIRARLPQFVEAARGRHAEWYVAFGERLHEQAERGGRTLLDLLATERDNMLAAWRYLLKQPGAGPSQAASLLRSLDPLYMIRGPYGAHVAMLGQTLDALPAGAPARAELLETRGRVLVANGQPRDAATDLNEAVKLAATPAAEGRALAYLGSARKQEGLLVESRGLFERAMLLLRRAGDDRMLGRVYASLASVALEEGRTDDARDLYREALQLHERSGDRRFEGVTLSNLGVLQQSVGDWDGALTALEKATAVHQELGNRRSEGICVTNLADLERDRGHNARAIALYRKALVINREAGNRRFGGICMLNAGLLYLEALEFEPAVKLLADALKQFEAVRDKRHRGLTLAVRGAVRARQRELVAAVADFDAARGVLNETGSAPIADAVAAWEVQLLLTRAAEAGGDDAARLTQQALGRIAAAVEVAGSSEHVRMALRVLKAWGAAASTTDTRLELEPVK